MNRFLPALLCAMAAMLSADTLKEWDFSEAAVPGLQYPHGNIGYCISPDVKTPDGESCGEFTIMKSQDNPVPWSLMIGFVSDQKLAAGMKFRYSFQIRADRSGKMMASCIQQDSPWKTIGNSPKEFTVTPQWQTITREFTVDGDFDCAVRTPTIMVGALPEGTVIHLGPVKFERLVNFIPLSLNPEWTLFRSPELKETNLNAITAVPLTLGKAAGETVELKDCAYVLAESGRPISVKSEAVFFNEFEAAADGMMQVGCAADYWFEFIVNGKTVYDTLRTGNRVETFLPTDHVFNFPVKRGRNLIAVRVLSGSSGWRFVCGKVPFRAKLSRITQIVRSKEWRPVKMDRDAIWNRRELRGKRVDLWKRIPGSALDLSQYVRKYDIDKCGRLLADAQGRLYFENEPGETVRLRGFNFMPGEWTYGFVTATKAELEELAEQIALSGLNVLRFHFLDALLVGNGGMPKQGKDRKYVSEVQLAQCAGDIPVEKGAADRYWYFLKCLRDRGIYVMLDIFTSTGMFTEAVMNSNDADTYGRFRIFSDTKYRNHWQAGFDYLLKTPSPYTGKAMIDDPQLVGITCYNEQEHLFNMNSRQVTFFTPEWREFRNPPHPDSVPEFTGKLLKSDTPDGAAARRFIRGKIQQMNDFYLTAVRNSGFKGFFVNWDMYPRNLEGDARADFNAVAMHTYHAHPGTTALYPPDYKQRLTFGGWLKNTMTVVGQDSSIVQNNYICRAAATRVLGKPFFMTEYSHCGFNRFSHEAAAMWAAYASLQDWQMLTPHAQLVRLLHAPFQPYDFDSAESISAVMNSLFCAFAWQRGDVQSAKHAVSFHIPENAIDSVEYTGAIGSGYNLLSMLTRIGSDYRNANNPVADLNIEPQAFVGARGMGMYVELGEESEQNTCILREQVALLRKADIIPAGNITDVEAGIFQSETGEICADIRKNTLVIDAPKFQAAVMKQSEPVALSALSVKSVSTPCVIAAISLDNEKELQTAKRILVVVGTMSMAENAVFSTENFDEQLDVGDIQQVMRSGQFHFSIANGNKGLPAVYALTLGGARECTVPAVLKDGRVEFTLDTSKLEYGTPYFEVVYP